MPESGLLGYPGKGPPVDLDPNTQLFTSSGTWTKPADCQWVRVILVGGGGGGGGGRKASNQSSGASERAQGGNGGGGAGVSFLDVPAGLLPSTVSVTIGAGGAGGAGATTDNSNGTAGSSGGTSTFGDLLSAEGGAGGGGGASGSAAYIQPGRGLLLGGFGSRAADGQADFPRRFSTTSGGANGGGFTDRDVVALPGYPVMATSPFSEPSRFNVLGNPGAGGLAGAFADGTNGRTGNYGNGGGGGGGARNPYNGGSGDSGGNGYCLITSYGTRFRPVDVQAFSSNGVWRKPSDPRLTTARVFVMGAGGGGGSGRRWDRTNAAYLTGSYLATSLVANSYASTPDAAAIDITGDIDVKVKLSAWNWSQGSALNGNERDNRRNRTLAAKWTESTNQRSWRFVLTTGGGLEFFWSSNGSNNNRERCNGVLNLQRYDIKWVRATMDVNNGSGQRVVKFYTSDDGTTWTQLGSTLTSSGTASLFNSSAPLSVGAINVGAGDPGELRFHEVIVENGYDGAGTVVFDADFSGQPAGTTSFNESSANAATVTVTTANVDSFGAGGGNGGAVSYAELSLADLADQLSVVVGAGGLGGAGVTNDYENGNHGTQGGHSAFGDIVFAYGGEQGYGGCTVGGSTSTNSNSFLNQSESYLGGSLTSSGSGGRGGSTNGNSVLNSGTIGACMTSGGGGGAGINSSNSTGSGGSSTRPVGYGALLADVTAAASGASLFPADLGMFGSTGGGGGNSNAATVDGGNGGRGSGGGGGAATANGTTSGAGGNGGDGYVVVVCV